MAFDLAAYLARFPDVCHAKFGRTYNFHSIEKKVEQVRLGKRWLVSRDVVQLFDPASTPFAHYWQTPDAKELDSRLRDLRLYLSPVPADPAQLVLALLRVFHNIGIASIVLRFVHPDRFGIFSTPVMNLLQVQRPRTVELYLAYCEELREWRQHFRMESVAATEMALWAFQSLASVDEEQHANAQRQFDAEVWIQRRRAGQVLRPFLQRYGPLELARILVDEDAKLAGKIAGEEYERLLNCAARKFYHRELQDKKGSAETLIDELAQDGHIELHHKTALNEVWRIRNKAVHFRDSPSAEEVEKLIDQIQKICAAWDQADAPVPARASGSSRK